MNTHKCDIVVVGAGLVGCALAVALAQNTALNVVLIDAITPASNPSEGAKKHEPSEGCFDARVVAINRQSEQWLRSLGVWDLLNHHRLCAYNGMEVWDGQGSGRMTFSAAEMHWPNLGYIIENSELLAALQGRLQALNVTQVSAKAVGLTEQTLTLDNQQAWQASLILAADGGESTLRQLANIAVQVSPYRQKALVTTVKTQQPHGCVARQRFGASGPLALLPLQASEGDSQQACSLVWSQDNEQADELMGLSDAAFCDALTRYSEACLGKIVSCETRQAIPLWQRHAQDYGRPGLILVGDAAHSIHPLAGQGVNLGFQDAEALMGLIQATLKADISLQTPRLINQYQQQRQWQNLAAIQAMQVFKSLFSQTNPYVVGVRNWGMQWLNQQDFLKRQLIKMAAGDFGYVKDA